MLQDLLGPRGPSKSEKQRSFVPHHQGTPRPVFPSLRCPTRLNNLNFCPSLSCRPRNARLPPLHYWRTLLFMRFGILLVSLLLNSSRERLQTNKKWRYAGRPGGFNPLHSNEKGGNWLRRYYIFAFYIICTSFCTIYKCPGGKRWPCPTKLNGLNFCIFTLFRLQCFERNGCDVCSQNPGFVQGVGALRNPKTQIKCTP